MSSFDTVAVTRHYRVFRDIASPVGIDFALVAARLPRHAQLMDHGE
jgi:hypothetical protein